LTEPAEMLAPGLLGETGALFVGESPVGVYFVEEAAVERSTRLGGSRGRIVFRPAGGSGFLGALSALVSG
jgi:hypothetical protein